MSTLADFYRKNAFCPSEDRRKRNRDSITQLGAVRLSPRDTETIPFSPCFDLEVSNYNAHSIPNGINMPLMIPGDREDQNVIFVDGRSLRAIVEDWIAAELRTPKYIAYCDPRVHYAFSCDRFSYDILSHVTSAFNMSSFVVFDGLGKFQISFDDDLAITMIVACDKQANIELFGRGRSFWDELFKVEFMTVLVGEGHLAHFHKHYAPFVPGIGTLKVGST